MRYIFTCRTEIMCEKRSQKFPNMVLSRRTKRSVAFSGMTTCRRHQQTGDYHVSGISCISSRYRTPTSIFCHAKRLRHANDHWQRRATQVHEPNQPVQRTYGQSQLYLEAVERLLLRRLSYIHVRQSLIKTDFADCQKGMPPNLCIENCLPRTQCSLRLLISLRRGR